MNVNNPNDLVVMQHVAIATIKLLDPLLTRLEGPVREDLDGYLTASLSLLLTAKREAMGLPTR